MSAIGLLVGVYVRNSASLLGTLSLDNAPVAGVAGSANVLGAKPGSTLTLTDTVGGLYSVAGTVVSWTSGVAAGTDHPIIRETNGGFANSPHDTALTVVVAAPAGGVLDFRIAGNPLISRL